MRTIYFNEISGNLSMVTNRHWRRDVLFGMHIENCGIDWRVVIVIGMPWDPPHTIHRPGCRCRLRNLLWGTWFCGFQVFGEHLLPIQKYLKLLLKTTRPTEQRVYERSAASTYSHSSIAMPYEKLNICTWCTAYFVCYKFKSQGHIVCGNDLPIKFTKPNTYVFGESSLVGQTINNSVLAFGILISIASLRSIIFHYFTSIDRHEISFAMRK